MITRADSQRSQPYAKVLHELLRLEVQRISRRLLGLGLWGLWPRLLGLWLLGLWLLGLWLLGLWLLGLWLRLRNGH